MLEKITFEAVERLKKCRSYEEIKSICANTTVGTIMIQVISDLKREGHRHDLHIRSRSTTVCLNALFKMRLL
jgi:hypothetical protein